MSPPSRPRPEAAVLRQAKNRPQDGFTSGLSPKGEFRSAQHEASPVSEQALQVCLNRHLAHAALVFVLDEELGTHHGLSWADFVLLTVLDAAGGAAPATALARTLCTPASHLLLRLLPLEKTGLVERAADGDGKRRVTLRPQGRQLLTEARSTAANACAP